MKPKTLDANQLWLPDHWVADGKPIGTDKFEDTSRRKYAAVKINKLLAKIIAGAWT